MLQRLVAAGAVWFLMQLLLGSALQGYGGDSHCTHTHTHNHSLTHSLTHSPTHPTCSLIPAHVMCQSINQSLLSFGLISRVSRQWLKILRLLNECMKHVIQSWFGAQTCPHYRPIHVHLNTEDISANHVRQKMSDKMHEYICLRK